MRLTRAHAQGGLKPGQILKAVSDPAAPGNMWEMEHRSNLRHILDQFRMQQSGIVQLEFFPEGTSTDALPGDKRLGRDQGAPPTLSAAARPSVCWC